MIRFNRLKKDDGDADLEDEFDDNHDGRVEDVNDDGEDDGVNVDVDADDNDGDYDNSHNVIITMEAIASSADDSWQC